MIAAIYARKGPARRAVTIGAILGALMLPACGKQRKSPTARDEIMLSCREGHGASLTLTIRGSEATLVYGNGATDSGTVVTSQEQYSIHVKDGEYRVNRVNGELTFWADGRSATVGYVPGNCKPVSKRIGD